MGTVTTGMTRLYQTRAAARKDPDMIKHNNMLTRQKHLTQPPFNWRAERVVRVQVTVETI